MHRSADDRAPVVAAVRVHRALLAGGGGRPLGPGPAVVGAGQDFVDLLEARLADVADEGAAGHAVDSHGPRRPETERPDRPAQAGRLAGERVVVGNRAVGVDAQDLPGEAVEALRIRARPLAGGHEQRAVGAERQSATEVVRKPVGLEVDDDALGGSVDGVAVQRVAADPLVVPRLGRRIGDVEPSVVVEPGIEGDGGEALLVDGGGRHLEDELPRLGFNAVEQEHGATLVGDEDPAVVGDRQRGRAVEVAGHQDGPGWEVVAA